MPNITCRQCIGLLADLRAAQVEAGVLCREVVVRAKAGGTTLLAERRSDTAYEHWGAAVNVLQAHIVLHPPIPR